MKMTAAIIGVVTGIGLLLWMGRNWSKLNFTPPLQKMSEGWMDEHCYTMGKECA